MQSAETSTCTGLQASLKEEFFKKGKDNNNNNAQRSFSCDVTTFLPPYWCTTAGYVMYANETQIKFTSQIVAFLKWIVLKVKVRRIKIKFSRLKNLTRHFVHTEPFYIFAQFTRNCRTVIKIASLDLLLFRPVAVAVNICEVPTGLLLLS